MTDRDRIESAVDALDMVSEYLRNAPGADINRGNMEALIRNIRRILCGKEAGYDKESR